MERQSNWKNSWSNENKRNAGRVELPKAPGTESPVPQLTSVHATPGRGPYGDPRYRGNCSGLLIRDLLRFYRPKRVLDPMEGGGTCSRAAESSRSSSATASTRAGTSAFRSA